VAAEVFVNEAAGAGEGSSPPDLEGFLQVGAVVAGAGESVEPREQNALLLLQRESEDGLADAFLHHLLIQVAAAPLHPSKVIHQRLQPC
jgi:hypothetical protein